MEMRPQELGEGGLGKTAPKSPYSNSGTSSNTSSHLLNASSFSGMSHISSSASISRNNRPDGALPGNFNFIRPSSVSNPVASVYKLRVGQSSRISGNRKKSGGSSEDANLVPKSSIRKDPTVSEDVKNFGGVHRASSSPSDRTSAIREESSSRAIRYSDDFIDTKSERSVSFHPSVGGNFEQADVESVDFIDLRSERSVSFNQSTTSPIQSDMQPTGKGTKNYGGRNFERTDVGNVDFIDTQSERSVPFHPSTSGNFEQADVESVDFIDLRSERSVSFHPSETSPAHPNKQPAMIGSNTYNETRSVKEGKPIPTKRGLKKPNETSKYRGYTFTANNASTQEFGQTSGFRSRNNGRRVAKNIHDEIDQSDIVSECDSEMSAMSRFSITSSLFFPQTTGKGRVSPTTLAEKGKVLPTVANDTIQAPSPSRGKKAQTKEQKMREMNLRASVLIISLVLAIFCCIQIILIGKQNRDALERVQNDPYGNTNEKASNLVSKKEPDSESVISRREPVLPESSPEVSREYTKESEEFVTENAEDEIPVIDRAQQGAIKRHAPLLLIAPRKVSKDGKKESEENDIEEEQVVPSTTLEQVVPSTTLEESEAETNDLDEISQGDEKDSNEVIDQATDPIKTPDEEEDPYSAQVATDSNFDNIADFPSDPRPGDIPVFWHVPKAGGSTIKDMTGSCLGMALASKVDGEEGHADDKTLEVFTTGDGSRYVNVDTNSVPGIDKAKRLGLASSGLADLVVSSRLHKVATIFSSDHKGRLFTILRHPIDRAVSMFNYLGKANWERTYDPSLQNMTIEEYAKSDRIENNWMVRILTNQYEGMVTESNLEAAKNLLSTKFLVGLLSEGEESWDRFEKYFNWNERVSKNPGRIRECLKGYITSGSNRGDTSNRKMVEENSVAHHFIRHHNKYDIELYEFAEKLFQVQGKILEQL